MKFTTFAAIAASAVLVSASPLRVLVVTSSTNLQRPEPFLGGVRFGHAVPELPMPVANLMARPGQAPDVHQQQHKRPCMGGIFRQKAVDVSNSFRKIFGFPLIESGEIPHDKEIHGGLIRIMPFMPTGGAPTTVHVDGQMNPGQGSVGRTKGGDKIQIIRLEQGRNVFVDTHQHNHPQFHHGHGHHQQDQDFFVRIQDAIMSLGPWEGRAVAFVLGCGIGVLLRMFFVISVVLYRSLRGSDEEHEYEQVLVFEVENENDAHRIATSAPPPYIYPVDEKATAKAAEPAQN